MGQAPSSCSSSSSCSCHALSTASTLHTHGLANTDSDSSSPASSSSCSSSSSKQRDLTLVLPDECLACVFDFLGSIDRNSCSLVCRRWNLVDARSRQRLVLLARSEISPSLPSLLRRFCAVSVLSLKCSRKLVSLNDDALCRIADSLTSLKKLKLKGCVDVSDDGLHAFSLRRPPSLAKISFAACGFGARGIVSLLRNCPSLRDLTLKRLRKLDAQSTPLSIDAYFEGDDDGGGGEDEEVVKKKKTTEVEEYQLERLCIKDLHNARIFIPLLRLSKPLKTLIVCRSSGNWDRVLESLQQREEASFICEIQMENVQMGDVGLIAVSNSCPDLEILYLSRVTDCSDQGLASIASSCRKLRKLHIDAWTRLGGRTIGDEGISLMATKCSRLQELVLMGIPVKASSLITLASNCPALERLAICNTESVGDPEMAVIAAKFLAVKKLCIKNCPISVKGIEAVVGGCSTLVKLKVKRCKGINPESVSRLREKKRSGVVISVDAGSLLFDGGGEGGTGSENEGGTIEDEDGARRRSNRRGERRRNNGGSSSLPSRANTRSSATHVICSSRGASLLRSKFANRSASGSRAHR